MFARVGERIDSAFLGSVCALLRANAALGRKIKACHENQFADDDRLRCSREDLEAMLEISIRRLERIENKAMGTLLGVAVAISLFGGTCELLGSNGPLAGKSYTIEVGAVALLIVAMMYLLGSGLLALRAYRIGQVFRPRLVDRAPVVDETREKIILTYCIEQNQHAATMRSNQLSAAFTCLRNGLIVVLMLAVLVAATGFAR